MKMCRFGRTMLLVVACAIASGCGTAAYRVESVQEQQGPGDLQVFSMTQEKAAGWLSDATEYVISEISAEDFEKLSAQVEPIKLTPAAGVTVWKFELSKD